MDTINDKIFKNKKELYNKIKNIRVGDYIKLKEGKITRVTYIWQFEKDRSIQTGGGEYGQYYFGNSHISYSGGLNPGLKESTLRKTKEIKKGRVWFFKDNFQGAGRGINYDMEFRVFEEVV